MRWLAIVVLMALLSSCGGTEPSTRAGESGELSRMIALPEPSADSDRSLVDVLAARRSTRDFSSEGLSLDHISQLLWAAQGVTSASGKRTAPSAGALYPLEIYLAIPDGLYHYLPEGHRLELERDEDLRARLADAALGQDAVASGAAVFIITAVYARTAQKYGDRAERYVHLEAGHAAQNVLLQATATDLGAVPIGAFDDLQVRALLDLTEGHEPLYLIPVGHPSNG